MKLLLDPLLLAVVTYLGVAVTFAGFAATLWQLHRTRTALTASNQATSELRVRLSGQAAAIHAANADARLKSAQRELRAGDWLAALDAMENLREVLLLLYRRHDHIEEQLRKQLPAFLKDLQDYCDYLDRRASAGIPDTKRNIMTRRLRELGNLITTLSDHLSERTQ